MNEEQQLKEAIELGQRLNREYLKNQRTMAETVENVHLGTPTERYLEAQLLMVSPSKTGLTVATNRLSWSRNEQAIQTP